MRRALSDRTRAAACGAALAAIALASRLPQLRSRNLLVDGDEAVLGLMAKHLLERREFPVFFWGQHYGLSTIEASLAAAAFRVFGIGALPLKIAMLALWTTGVLFLFAALTSIVGRRRGFWIAAVFVLQPAWAVWSMKARGGYLTAFAAASAVLWIVAARTDRDRLVRWIAAGALAAIVYLGQPIWLTGLLPIVAAVLVAKRRPVAAAAFAAAMLVPIAIVSALTPASDPAWAGPALGNPGIWGSRIRVAQQIYVNLTGSYYLTGTIDPPGRATAALAAAWCVLLAAAAGLQFYRLLRRRVCWWSHVLFAALCSTLVANWVLLFPRDGRYLLPVSMLLVALIGVELADLVDRGVVPARAAAALTAAALAAGSASMVEFRNFSFLWTNPAGGLSEHRRLELVIGALVSRDATHVFSMNGLLDTQLMFYSRERVIARWASARDRHPAYVDEADRALAAGARIAVVGYTNDSGAPGCWDVPICTGGIETLVPDPASIFTVDGKYFVYVGATPDLLRTLRFELPD